MFKVNLDDVGSILSENFLGESGDLTPENPENNVLIVESILMENLNQEQLQEMLNDRKEIDTLINLGLLSEKSIVRLDKGAKFSRAESQAILAIAREKGDRDFKKLVTVWKMRKLLLEKLARRYGSQAKQRARQMVRAAQSSATKIAKKLK